MGESKYFFENGCGSGKEVVNELEGKLEAILQLSILLMHTAALNTYNGGILETFEGQWD